MHKHIVFLLILYTTTMSLGSGITENERSVTDLKDKLVKNQGKLPLFPKRDMKFVITLQPYREKVYNHYPKGKIMNKFELTTGNVLKSNIGSTTKPVSRRPLMKLRTYTVPSLTNGRFDKIHGSTQRSVPILRRAKTTALTSQPYFKETTFQPEQDEQYKQEITTLVTSQSAQKAPVRSDDTFSYVEEQDRNEFIFLEKNVKNVDDNIIEDNSIDFEITTSISNFENKDLRFKRSVNIIEEENNMATTIAGFTGRDTQLNHNVYFKNINS